RPNSSRWAAISGPTKDGIGCCGSPTDKLITGLPGLMSAISSVSRTNGDRPPAGAAGLAGSRRVVVIVIGLNDTALRMRRHSGRARGTGVLPPYGRLG